MTSAEYDRGLEDGAALAHRDAFVLVRELRIENERLRAALREVAATLGTGPCAAIACTGCAHEMVSAASTARDALAANDS